MSLIPPPDAANHPLVVAVRSQLTNVDPLVVEILLYLFARVINDPTLERSQVEKLEKLIQPKAD